MATMNLNIMAYRIYKPKAEINLKRLINVIVLFIIVASIPLTFLLVNQKQNIRQSAQGSTSKLDQLSKEKEIKFSSSELLVKFKPSTSSSLRIVAEKTPAREIVETGNSGLDSIAKMARVRKIEPVFKKSTVKALQSKGVAGEALNSAKEMDKWFKVSLEGKKDIIKRNSAQAIELIRAINLYKNNPDVENVEPDYIVSTTSLPNDTYLDPDQNNTWSTGSWNQIYEDMWGLKKINMEEVWNQASSLINAITVADIDTGVDYNHEDLQDKIWKNSGEVGNGKENNGIDDDNNGYIDDFRGWNFVNNNNNPMDDHGHGTHTAGTIAASGNNQKGVAGVNTNTKIMILKFLDMEGNGYSSDGILALLYAADMGAKVSSNSWSSPEQSEFMDDAIEYTHGRGMVTVVAAGNNNSDALDFSPASSDRAITVAASDYNDQKAWFSNFGEKIDVIAPGVDILSTRASTNPMCDASRTVGSNYCKVSGTSMATPHVAGLAALILSKNPDLSNEQVRQIIREGTVDLGESGKDINFGYGRIDAGKSLNIKNPLSPIITSPKSRSIISQTSFEVLGSINGLNLSNYKIEVGTGRLPTYWTTVTSSNSPVSNGLLASVDTTKLGGGISIIRATAIDTMGRTYQFQVHDIELPDNFDASITSPEGLIPAENIEVTGTANTKNSLIFSNYLLEWGVGKNPVSWSVVGVNLDNGGTKPVTNGKLGSLDTSGFAAGDYSLRIKVFATNNSFDEFKVTFTVDKDLIPGWPKFLSANYPYSRIVPSASDLDNDGKKELVVLEPDGKVYVFRKDGTNFPAFPLQVDAGYNFMFPVNVEDIDGDGKKEIIASSSRQTGELDYTVNKIYIIKNDGTFYPGWSNLIFPANLNLDTTPTISDINTDGKKDMVFLDCSGKLHVLDLNGAEIPGFPKQALPVPKYCNRIQVRAINITDINKDQKPEIIINIFGKLYVFDNLGNVLPGWPYSTTLNGSSVFLKGSVATGDVNGDGKMDLFVIGGASSGNYLYGLNPDGTLLSGWPVRIGPLASGDLALPAIFDMDNDGKMEIAIAEPGDTTSGYGLKIYDGSGNLRLQEEAGQTSQWSVHTPAISDVDGDGKLEFMSSSFGTSAQVIDDNGRIYWERYMSDCGVLCYYQFFPAITSDMDNNGKMEIAVVRNLPFGNKTLVYLWEIPSNSQAKYEWPMYAHDSSRTGRLDQNIIPFPTRFYPTRVLTPTPILAPTSIIVSTTKLEVTILPDGVSLNPSYSPRMKIFRAQVFDTNDQLIKTINQDIRFTNGVGFKGEIDLGDLPAGTYTFKFKTKGYLKEAITNQQITSGVVNSAPSVTLLAGDIHENNKVNNNDYENNISGAVSYVSCFGQTTTVCLNNADLNLDKKVDNIDYSLLMSNMGKTGK